jgi:DNA (cytosine-5)-methyltransferase 1
MGYHRAGFEVVGVDLSPQPHYPFEFHRADAMQFSLDNFDVIHASPPCTGFSVASVVHRNAGKKYTDLLTPIRERLKASGKPFVIENVPGAPIAHHITLCGMMFGLMVFRHRHFESSALIMSPEHPSHCGKKIGEGFFSVAGGSGRWKSWGKVFRNVSKGTADEWRNAMGIDWMTRNEIKLAIPPAYTEYIGSQLINSL